MAKPNTRNIITAILLLLLGLLQYQLWIGEGSVPGALQLSRTLGAQRMENARLAQRNQALAAEVRDLKKGHAAIEERARTGLGMIKRGETFYQVVEEPAKP